MENNTPVTLIPASETQIIDLEGFRLRGGMEGLVVREGDAEIRIARNVITTDSYTGDYEAGVLAVSGEENRRYRLRRNTITSGLVTAIFMASSIGVELPGPVEMIGNRIASSAAVAMQTEGVSQAVIVHWNSLEESIFVNNIIKAGVALQSVALGIAGSSIFTENTVMAEGYNTAYALDMDTGPATLVDNIFSARGATAVVRGSYLSGSSIMLDSNNFFSENAGVLMQIFGRDFTTVEEIEECNWMSCDLAQNNFASDPLLDITQHLTSDSPCVDRGTDPASYLTDHFTGFDFDGKQRPIGAAWDVGADESEVSNQ